MIPRRGVLVLAVAALALAAGPGWAAGPLLVIVSSFAPGERGGIQAYEFRPEDGSLKPLRRTAGPENPFFLALSPDRKFLYATHARDFGGKESEQVAAYQLTGRTGELKLLNRQSAEGTAACSLDVDRTGRVVVVANYGSGSVAALPVRADGSLGPPTAFVRHQGSSVNPGRQKEPHAHCVAVSPDNKYVLAADLGIDQVLVYRLDADKAALAANDPPFARSPAGAGPRHLAFSPDGRRVYAINELSNSVTVFDYDAASGKLKEVQTVSTVPEDFKGTSYCADVKLTPDGKFLYGTNRGHDSIAGFRVGVDGRLERVGITPSGGRGPQNLAVTPDGRWLLCANMPGNTVAVFRIDPETGRLTAAGEPMKQAGPSCIMIVP